MIPILKYPDFRALSLARLMFSLALQAQATIVGWWIYDLTRDPLDLGLIGMAEAIPAIGFALHAGHWVDRGKPYLIYRAMISFALINALALSLLAWRQAEVSAGTVRWLIYLSMFLGGIARSFVPPSLFSLVPRLIPREVLSASSAWISALFQIAAVIGPAMAGFIYAGPGLVTTFLVIAGIIAASLYFLTWITPEARQFQNKVTALDTGGIREGIRFVLKHPVILSAMSLDLFSVLFGGVVMILPAFATDVLGTDARGLGLLRAAQAAGSLITCLWLVARPLQVISGRALLAVVFGFGVSTLVFGASRMFWLSWLALALSGAFDAVSMVIRGTLLQLLTPDHMRGRVSSVSSVFISSSNEIGAFESGVAAKLLGLAPSVIFGGTMTILVVLGTWVGVPQLRQARVKR